MKIATLILISVFLFAYCTPKPDSGASGDTVANDSVQVEEEEEKPKITLDDIKIEKDLLYDQHTLADEYPYKDTTREFQWKKIKERLFYLDSIQLEPAMWATLQNYKNMNGEAPTADPYVRNEYKLVADTFGVARYQSVPLFLHSDSVAPFRYGRDGSLVKILEGNDTTKFVKIENMNFSGDWIVPRKYVKTIGDTVTFKKAIFVDRHNQNIATLEKVDDTWFVRSMNPATTGRHNPPYGHETPIGLYVIQEKKAKMLYLKDGSSELAGYAPWASRFCNGAYLHGVPTNSVNAKIIEYSSTLGTIPRSHMCVRNATSHAKFMYDWLVLQQTVVFVID